MINKTVERALELPAADIGKLFDDVHPKELQDLEREASALAQRAAWLSEYLEYRGAAGFGDHGHDDAKKAADKRLKDVRKALGYSYP